MTTIRPPRWYIFHDVELLGVNPVTQIAAGQRFPAPWSPATLLVYSSADFPEGVTKIAEQKAPGLMSRLGFSSTVFRLGSPVDKLAEFERTGPLILDEVDVPGGATFEQEFQAELDANDIAVPEVRNDGFVGLYPAFGGAAFNDEVVL